MKRDAYTSEHPARNAVAILILLCLACWIADLSTAVMP